MKADIVRRQTPEERELERKRAELAELETELAQRELDLATLQAELRVFEKGYLRKVGVLYAILDELEAQIAEELARLYPKDVNARERAEQARAQAGESARTADGAQEPRQVTKFKPSESLKKLFREAAKRMHPDLATDEKESARRHKAMAEVNQAYEEGNEARLQAILRDWESSPEAVPGEGVGAELVRVIRKIAQVEERLRRIVAEIEALQGSELYQLRARVERAEAEGRDLLAEMAAGVNAEIAEARERLDELKRRVTSR